MHLHPHVGNTIHMVSHHTVPLIYKWWNTSEITAIQQQKSRKKTDCKLLNNVKIVD